jgi:hypothetical protein
MSRGRDTKEEILCAQIRRTKHAIQDDPLIEIEPLSCAATIILCYIEVAQIESSMKGMYCCEHVMLDCGMVP